MLHHDVAALKEQSGAEDIEKLSAENDQLRQKLKEKTYELVALRKEFNYLKHERSKKKFKMF